MSAADPVLGAPSAACAGVGSKMGTVRPDAAAGASAGTAADAGGGVLGRAADVATAGRAVSSTAGGDVVRMIARSPTASAAATTATICFLVSDSPSETHIV